ncbi:MAG: glutamine amidotransferase of anthranilate synthase [Cyanobacteria bacterium RYN_339]|nr:glutamine amidotransferase of anthranilate synthase [Cyanobacteria bacterium RYN_339]
MRLLVIDNYDSFTYNLVQYLGDLGAELDVHRNDRITVDEIRAKRPDAIVLSPGPGHPGEAGIVLDVIAQLGDEFPILGVCLGHQAIGQAFGGEVVRAGRIMHGKTSQVRHDDTDLFKGLPRPFTATRYHSLVVRKDSLPPELVATAWSEDDGEIMGLRHRDKPIFGVQFHPESILTPDGKQLLANFVRLVA